MEEKPDEAVSAAPVRRSPAPTILAVDDSRTNLGILGERLSALGMMVVLCETGAEAVDMIAARTFDLVLLDVVMPGMSGFNVLTEIRGCSDSFDLPVMMITGSTDTAIAIACLRAGADDYVTRPFDFDLLAARIERVTLRARRIAELKRSTANLDARLATRAMELGEARLELAECRAAHARLAASIGPVSSETSAA